MIKKFLMEDIIEDAPISVVGLNQDADIFYINKQFGKLLGFSKDEFLNNNLSEFISPAIAKSDFFSHIKSRVAIHDEELIFKGANHKIVYFMGSTMYHTTDNGEKYSYLFLREITNYKRTEQLFEYLHQSGEILGTAHDLNTAIESITKIIVPVFADWFTLDVIKNGEIVNLKLANEDMEYVKWALEYRRVNNALNNPNSALYAAITQGKDNLIARITPEMIDNSDLNEESKKVFHKLNLQSSIVVPIKVKDNIIGAISFVSATLGRYFDDVDLRFAHMFANRVGLTLENIQLLEDAKQEIMLRQMAERKKDEFINVASHELKTPITTIRASVQFVAKLLKQGANSPFAKVESLLERADESVLKLSKLVDDLLNVNKIEKERFKLEKTKFNLAQFAADCYDHVQLKEHQVVKVEGDLDLTIFADKFKIDQVLVNLINNALKYAPASNEIIVSIEKQADFAKISVQDFGPGIEASKVANIFKRYYQAEEDYTYSSGMGLGLFIAERIINKHGGQIGVETSLGNGSTFWFTLPLNN